MNRKKKLLLVAHCLLNCNAKVEGLADCAGAQSALLQLLFARGYGIIQLPCPELTIYGLKRWGHVKEQFATPYFRRHCRQIFQPILDQLLDYKQNGYQCNYLIGVNGSPSCGVEYTQSAPAWGGELSTCEDLPNKLNILRNIPERGIFMEEIAHMLAGHKLSLRFIAIDEEDPASSIDKIIKEIEEEK
ncbi:MAG TPA: hypothetical protein PKA10_04615 [Selenomonadales bacterium]|nr:hypothetical protein [Selenomonadales bacterium]